jgi:hypothetical protein
VAWADDFMRFLESGDDGTMPPKTTCHLYVATALRGLSERAVVNLLNVGEIAVAKAHGRWEIDIASLRAYAANRKEQEP